MDDLSALALVVLAIAAVATSTVSAIAGMGGGLMLIGVLVILIDDPIVAVGVHAAIQLASNASRALSLRSLVDHEVVGWHVLGIVPGTIAGYVVADQLPVTAGRLAIALVALTLAWWPFLRARGGHVVVDGPNGGSSAALKPERMGLVGLAQGLGSVAVGATGPAAAPFFRAAAPNHRVFVATFAVSGAVGHLIKLVVLGLAGEEGLGANVEAIVVGILGVTAGSLIGARLSERVSEWLFGWIFRCAVTVLALSILVRLAI